MGGQGSAVSLRAQRRVVVTTSSSRGISDRRSGELVAADRYRGSGRSARFVYGCNQRIVALIRSGHVSSARSYVHGLGELCHRTLNRPRKSVTFFNIYVTSLACKVADNLDQGPAAQSSLTSALLTLNGWVSKRIRDSEHAYSAHLDRVQQARVDERLRIARELHDRLGEVLTVGLRQLDLYEITGPQESHEQSAIAREVLVEAMRRLRLVLSGLRDDPVTSLEKALLDYLDRVCADADVRLAVTGDEAWAPAVVRDEAFLIVREALRNALKHGAPQSVLIGINLTIDELRVRVHDDGRGFACDAGEDLPPAGTGLATMRERAALLGGSLTVSSEPGRGTSVELRVSLPGQRDDQPR